MTDQSAQFEDILNSNSPVAIVLKQYLRPVEGIGEPIFPPTYPMPTYRGRVYTVGDGDYKVSVELPPFNPDGGKKDNNSEQRSQDVAGYNIDEFRDGTNICEIDSPQSQANRLEPLFETIKGGKLVPQIAIKVGKDKAVNLLAAGHRAADAVVRFSSLAAEFDSAFKEVSKGNHLELAKLAPTSILFGVWDSRGTQVKLPRIIKSEIRATNVEKLTKSAQFNPAIDFIQSEAIDESFKDLDGDKDPLSAEGMRHVPAPRAAGGIIVHGELKRVVRVNLVALRTLCAHKDGERDEDETEKLQRYILGLALVAAVQPLPMNLREGCLLCGMKDEKHETTIKLVKVDGGEDDFSCDVKTVENFADLAAREFFGEQYDKKDHLDAIFESGVANKFLAMAKKDREKIERGGPITADAIRRYEERGKDPLKPIFESIKEIIKQLPKQSSQKNNSLVTQPELFSTISKQLEALTLDEQIDQSVRDFGATLQTSIANDQDTSTTLKSLDKQIRGFNKQRKETAVATSSEESANLETA